MRAKDIKELVNIVEQSNIGELEITYWWGRKIRISKAVSPAGGVKSGSHEFTSSHVTAPTAVVLPFRESPETSIAPTIKEGSDKMVEVKAPMVGTFYRASAPDADPYVNQGDMISPNKVLCIIEAMKCMNEIEAEISGKIIKIMVENGQAVEYNQPLFLVEVG